MKARAPGKPEQINHQGELARGNQIRSRQVLAVADNRPEMGQQGGLLSLMATSPRLQRQCACGAASATGGSCAACEQKAAGQGAMLLQKKLAIGASDDPLEQEAERVADQVMRTPMPAAQRKCSGGGKLSKCSNTRSEAAGGLLQLKHSDTAALVPEVAPPLVNEVLREPGRPLDEETRAFMEPRFGYDLSTVRLHTDARSAQSATAMNARAYTVGRHIVFAHGQYSPGSESGRSLLAHELTHTAQQAGSVPMIQRQEFPSAASSDSKTVPRPPYIPLEANVQLKLITLSPQLLEQLPEGEVVGLTFPVQDSAGVLVGGPFSSIGAAAIQNTGQTVLRSGFNAAGPNAIGIIGFPGRGVGWGHTAVYVRVNGQITMTRGFMPQMMSSEFLGNMSGVRAGATSVPGVFTSASGGTPGLPAFMRDAAQTIEFPVSLEQAQQAMAELPNTGVPPEGFAQRYSAKPAKLGDLNATNCVGAACSFVEGQLGGKVGTSKQGPIAEPANPEIGLQGRFMKASNPDMAAEVGELNALPKATGAGARGAMPTKFKVVKWGGRAFLVLGGVLAIKHTLEAPDEEKPRVASVEGSAFLAGVGAGALAGLACGPGALVCSIVFGAAAGIAAAIVAGEAANVAYDEALGNDEKVRQWIARHSAATLASVPAEAKVRMILALMAGWISGEDVQAIETICASVSAKTDADLIRTAIEPQIVPMMTSIGQRTQVRVALSRMTSR